jgi:hypothetical protein
MCPPLGHSGARIGPALLMRRAQGPSCGEVRSTGGGGWECVLGISRGGNIGVSGCRGRGAACSTGCKTKCQTTLCARRWRAFRQGRPCLSFLAVSLSPTQPFDRRRTQTLPSCPVAANFRPCRRPTSVFLYYYHSLQLIYRKHSHLPESR